MAIISRSRSLIKEDLIKVGKGALIAAFGAAAFYLLEALPNIDFGSQVTPVAVAVLSVLGNLFRKWWEENKY